MAEIRKGDLHRAYGMCQPLKALGGEEIDAVVVAGIGWNGRIDEIAGSGYPDISCGPGNGASKRGPYPGGTTSTVRFKI